MSAKVFRQNMCRCSPTKRRSNCRRRSRQGTTNTTIRVSGKLRAKTSNARQLNVEPNKKGCLSDPLGLDFHSPTPSHDSERKKIATTRWAPPHAPSDRRAPTGGLHPPERRHHGPQPELCRPQRRIPPCC